MAQGVSANVTPVMNQAKALTKLVISQNQTPANQLPPQGARPKQYHSKPTTGQTVVKLTNQQTGQEPLRQ